MIYSSPTFALLLVTYFFTTSVSAEQPQVRFTVNPDKFMFGGQFSARCTISRFDPSGQNFEVTFYYVSPANNLKTPIGTYLITNQLTPNWRSRIHNEAIMTVTPGFKTTFPDFDIIVIPRANETKSIYGCYMKSSISLNAEPLHSNIWNANGTTSLAPSVFTLILFALIKLILA